MKQYSVCQISSTVLRTLTNLVLITIHCVSSYYYFDYIAEKSNTGEVSKMTNTHSVSGGKRRKTRG